MTTFITLDDRGAAAFADGRAWALPELTSELLVEGGAGAVLRDALKEGDDVSFVLAPALVESRIHAAGPDGPSWPSGGGAKDDRGSVIAESVSDESTPRYMAKTADALLEALVDAVHGAGLELGSITTADFAWAAYAAEFGGASTLGVVELPEAGELRIYALSAGRPLAWRRLPPAADPREMATVFEQFSGLFTPSDTPPVVVALGSESVQSTAQAAAEDAGFTTARPTGALADDPLAAAAAFGGRGPGWVPRSVRAGAFARNRRMAWLAAAAAVLMLVASAVLDTVGLQREIAAVQEARGPMAADVSAAIAADNAAALHVEAIDGLERLRSTAPRWTSMMTSLSDRLPRDTRLRSLRASADSVYLELEGADVAGAVAALRDGPHWTGLRAVTSVETELLDEGGITERLTVAALVQWAPSQEPSP